MKKSVFLFACFALFAISCNLPYDNGEWNEYTKIYRNTTYNLQWDLSGTDLNALDKSSLPKNIGAAILFCANNVEDMVVASFGIQRLSDDGGRHPKNYDIWEHTEEFKEGFTKSLSAQNDSGISYDTKILSCEKCEFLNLKALRFTVTQEFRYPGYADFPINFLYVGYSFMKDRICIMPMVMITPGYSSLTMDDANALLQKIEYIESKK